jgi:hypothetical protein
MINSLKNRSETLQDRFALKTASYLTGSSNSLPYDISERLRAARVRAVCARKIETLQTVKSMVNNGSTAALNWDSDDRMSWWGRIGLILPLVALVVGLLSINIIQNENRAQEVAEVDAALLTDELPPAAFADPGFVQFLKSSTQVQ